jgi:aminomethyltransferase
VADAITEAGRAPVDEWDRWAILAIQGPQSFDLFERVFESSGATELKLHAWMEIDVFGEQGMVARTGYTGERGFELYAPAATSRRAHRALLDGGATPVGLGARDTLRLEMGYALYGHELSLEVNPLEASLGWVLAWDTPFRGREALLEVKQRGPARRLVGIRCTQKGVPRQDHAVLADGRRVGTVTSGNYSPTLDCGIALALTDATATLEPGVTVEIDAVRRRIAGAIVKPPFIRKDD